MRSMRVIVMLLLMISTISGCNPRPRPPRPVPTGSQVAILEPNEPAPFRGVLLGPERWRRIYERLLECEEQ